MRLQRSIGRATALALSLPQPDRCHREPRRQTNQTGADPLHRVIA